MDYKAFCTCMASYQPILRKFFLKRLSLLPHCTKDKAYTLEELVGATVLECCKIPYDTKDESEFRKAYCRKAKDAWANYFRQLNRSRPELQTLEELYEYKVATSPFSRMEAIDMWSFLRSHITPDEERLFRLHIEYGQPLRQLAAEENQKLETIRRRYYRIRKKLYKALQAEALIS